MTVKTLLIQALVVGAVVPLGAVANNKRPPDRAMLEKMEAVPCGSKEKGVMGLGAVWASVGVTRVNNDEKLCPQYLVRTDTMDYQIRPTDGDHPVVLPVGHEIEYRIKKDVMYVKVPDGDKKERTYQVVGMQPSNPAGEASPPAGGVPSGK